MKAVGLTKETILDIGISDRGFPVFKVGDTIEVAQTVKEGDKERIQMFEGVIIAFKHNGIATTFTVRRIGANGIGVERIFPYYSKNVSAITMVKQGHVRRAKLHYLRGRTGKAARIKEDVMAKEESKQAQATAAAK